MKVEIQVDDLLEIYRDYDDDISYTYKDVKQRILSDAIQVYVNELYSSPGKSTHEYLIREQVNNIIKEHKEEIINRVIDKVSDKILANKLIKEQMPKASELTNINKEWVTYFEELVDKALKKKFK